MHVAHHIQNLHDHIQQHRFSLIYLQSSSCGVCTVFHQQINSLLEDLPTVVGIEANIAEIPKVASDFHLFTAPAVLFFVNGKEIWRSARFIDMKGLKAVIERYLNEYENNHLAD